MNGGFKELYRCLEELGFDAFLISDFINIKYLTGFSGSYGFLLLLDRKRYLFTDSRYYERAKKEIKDVNVYLIRDNWPDVLSRFKIKKLGFEENSVSYGTYREWKKKLRNIRLVPTRNVVEKIRQIKRPFEISEIKKTVRTAEEILCKIKRYIRAGITELELQRKIEGSIRNIYGLEPSFHTIVAFGSNSSMPHALSGSRKLTNNRIVLIDLGVKAKNGYSSDLTRTFWVGRITKKFEEVYNVVLNAQKLAVEGIRPARRICDVDSLARDYIRRRGYGKYFGHSLGHGIGLAVHELPRINKKNKDRLEPGMVFSVEPGVYMPGWGGVRIEDLVLVTKDGCEVLTKSPKQLEDIVITGCY